MARQERGNDSWLYLGYMELESGIEVLLNPADWVTPERYPELFAALDGWVKTADTSHPFKLPDWSERG